MSRKEEFPEKFPEKFLDLVREALNRSPRGMFQCPDNGAGGMPDDEETHLPVRTSLLYPGGGPINVYVRASRSGGVVTDQGIAAGMIGRHLPAIAGQAPGRLMPTARNICEGLDVEIQGREWTVRARTPEDVGQAAMTLAQALLRMSIVAPIFKIINEG